MSSSDFHKAYNQFISLSNLLPQSRFESPKERRASLKRMGSFLLQLGNPERQMKFVHVAGTSGKGSVVNLLRHILHAEGKVVGTYTSPHTTSFLERFGFGEDLLSPAVLTAAMQEISAAYEVYLEKHAPLSFFELSTILAIHAFKQAGAEWCILEAGCGGRLDASNVIPTPEVAIITNINKDHTEVLGDSLSAIAYEKAGITKKNGVVLCGESRPKLRKIFKDEAVKHHAALFFVNIPNDPLIPAHYGQEQQHNAALAMRAAQEIGIPKTTIEKAFAQIRPLPCRFETIQQQPRIILDGAHSPAKIASTVRLLKEVNQPVRVLYGSALNKDTRAMLDQLAGVAASISTTRFLTTFRKAANPHGLLAHVPKNQRGKAFLDPFEALDAMRKNQKKNEVIMITGSLFLAGELRTRWIDEEDILTYASSFPAKKLSFDKSVRSHA